MPISIVAKCVPAIMIVCGFLLMFYYGGGIRRRPRNGEHRRVDGYRRFHTSSSLAILV